VAKAVPAKKAAVSKKRASVKKTSVAKKSDQAKIVQSEKATSTSSTIYFESGSSKLSAKELVKLKSFYSKVKYSKGTVVINGHSDASAKGETTTGNLLLSNERAANVLQSLNKMGLGNQIKLEMGTLGDTKPAASNDTPEGRKLNRRVELSFNPE